MKVVSKEPPVPREDPSEGLSPFYLICRLLGSDYVDEKLQVVLGQLSTEAWMEFWKSCQIHSVFEIVYARLVEEMVLPGDAGFDGQKLEERLYRSAAKNTQLTIAGESAYGALVAQGIKVLPLKGLLLQEILYSESEIRPMNDIDLLVHKTDIPKAIEVLRSVGFQQELYFGFFDSNTGIKHVPPMVDHLGRLLELHWTLIEEIEPFKIGIQEAWDCSRSYWVGDRSVDGMCPEHMLIHLAIHGTYQHYLTLGLRPLLDITRLLKKYGSELDWEKVVKTSRAWKGERVVWLTLALAQTLLDAPVPETNLLDMKPDQAEEILRKAIETISHLNPRQTMLSPDLLSMDEVSDFPSKLKLTFRRIFLPKETMARLYQVKPDSMKIWMTYPRRVIELFRRYWTTSRKLKDRDRSLDEEVERYKRQLEIQRWLGASDG